MKRLALFFVLAAPLFSEEKPQWTYQETVEGKSVNTEWFVEKEGDALHLKGVSPKSTIDINCTPDYVLEKMKYVSKKGKTPKEYVCQRTNNRLVVEAKEENSVDEKRYSIGNSPWIQEFGFGLRPFMASSSAIYKFCIINPKDLTLNHMVARKEKIETLEVNGKNYKAQKIKITLQGYKKVFWTAYAWFDVETNNLVLYRGNKGPNTPTTTITLANN